MENDGDRKSPMDDQERKQVARRGILQEHSDFAIAVASEILPSIESDSEEYYYSSEEENNGNDYEYFESQELEFLEGEDSNSDSQDMEDDDIDPDELSYEELIALGELIGEEKRGLSLGEICKCLRPCKGEFTVTEKTNEMDRCVICQVEYEGGDGESLVVIPCGHPYHSQCIINWLQIKKICPICTSEVSPPNN